MARLSPDSTETKYLPTAYDCLAPDCSEIRILAATERGSSAHCTLPPGAVSLAVAHRLVEEIWHFIRGRGQVWRKLGELEHVVDVFSGASLTIPAGAHFQFRSATAEPLEFLLTTMPPWPGDDEAYRVEDHWPPSNG